MTEDMQAQFVGAVAGVVVEGHSSLVDHKESNEC